MISGALENNLAVFLEMLPPRSAKARAGRTRPCPRQALPKTLAMAARRAATMGRAARSRGSRQARSAAAQCGRRIGQVGPRPRRSAARCDSSACA
eukprot:4905897-Pyramimonas_sp.AAC.1